MKSILMLTLFLNTGCVTGALMLPFEPETKLEWDIDANDPVQLATLKAHVKECSDYAFHAKVAGSKYSRQYIEDACVEQKGYKLRRVAVK